ncbi:hypothetical protein O6H91_12G031300 [Diphasiastrum complanatum]|uniref:Uncharacterized protein n=1 Tax=Diphasiastrum complanatum TaxID=34168 RepID=A0ACC2C034_DIPCM|nr:hypothetical protein O6H91_12G031300 [Diphasiastrum complanatum]
MEELKQFWGHGAAKAWERFGEGMFKPLAALVILAMAILMSYLQKLDLEREMIYSIMRSFLQLSLVGFILEFIFKQKNPLWIIAIYLFMVLVAGYTAGKRAKHIPNSSVVAGFSILVGTFLTMNLLIWLNVFPITPQFIIPVAGMMVGNSMTTTGVTLKRLRDDLRTQQNMVETALALGATPRQAIIRQVKKSLVIALSPALDNAKIVGLITLPGAMTGLIMGGQSPLKAIQLQMVIMNMLLGASTLASIISTYIICRFVFTKTYQLKTEILVAE